MQRRAGDCPVMVGSKRCHLEGHGPAQLCKGREEAGEMGGYFIVRGIERVIRLLQVLPPALYCSCFFCEE